MPSKVSSRDFFGTHINGVRFASTREESERVIAERRAWAERVNEEAARRRYSK